MQRRLSALFTLTVFAGVLAGCGGSATPSQADIQATIAAGVAATSAAQQQAVRPTAAAPATAAPATAVANDAPTSAPFAPSAATPVVTTGSSATSSATASATTGSAPSDAAPADQPVTFTPTSAGNKAATVNLELVFDSSGSMAEKIGSETKIEAARRSILQTIDQLPDNAPNFNVGFRVFGHKGNNTQAGKAESCASTDLYVPVQGVNKNALRQQAGAYQPTGWTPISLALQKAGEDLKAGENTKNVIIMVTDGEETCNGDPCAVSQALAQSGSEVRIDVVGFGLTPDVSKNLKCIGDNSGGSYTDAQNGAALLTTLQELVGAAIKRSYLRIVAFDQNGKQATHVLEIRSLADSQGQAIRFDIDSRTTQTQGSPLGADGEQLLRLEPGTYQFTISQERGYDTTNLSSPRANGVLTYTAQIVEGQETVAAVGVGALQLVSAGVPPEYGCFLRLEVAIGGKWQKTYDDGGASCSPPRLPYVDGGLPFGTVIPLQPGNYRVLDANRNRIVGDVFQIAPGKTVKLTVQGN